MLFFGQKPAVSFKKFIAMCGGLIPDSEVMELESSADAGAAPTKGGNATLRKWRAFDMALRNELVKIRAPRLKADPSKYLRQDGYDGLTGITHIALNARRKASLLESEKFLDLERWRYLDGLQAGHHFDLDFLVVYVQKLLIGEKWDRIAASDTRKAVSDILEPAVLL